MGGPLILVFHVTLQEGKFDDYKSYADELVDFVETNEPRLIACEVYANDDGTEISHVFIHPDAESEDFHAEVAAEKVKEGQQYYAGLAVDVYGTPSDAVLEGLSRLAESGVPVRVNARHLGGFRRQLA